MTEATLAGHARPVPRRVRILGARTSAAEPRLVLGDHSVLAAVAVLLVLELLYVAFAHPPVGIGDQTEYQRIGHDFGSWWFSDDARRTPGYPLLLALTYKLGLGDTGVAVWQSLAVVALTLGATVLVGLAAGLRAARAGAWAQALYLPLFSHASLMLSDVPAVAASTLGVVFVVLAIRGERIGWWHVAAAAVALEAAVMIRPINLLFVAVGVGVLLLRADGWRSALAVLGIFAVTFAVLFGPWIGRNEAKSSKALVLGSSGQVQLAWGLHLPWDERTGKFSQADRSWSFWANMRPDGFNEAKAESVDVWGTLGRDLRERPGEFLWSRVVGQYQMWIWPTTARTQYAEEDPVPYPLIMAEHLLLLVLGGVGLFRLRRHVVARVVGLLVLVTVVEYLFYFPGPRYKFPVMPFIAGAGGVTLVWLRGMVAARRRTGTAAAAPQSST